MMHLESQSTARPPPRGSIQADLDQIETVWKGSSGGLIFAVGHVGNNEAIAAGVADRGWPISVVADDSSLPRDVRALPAPPRGVGRPRHPVAQPPRDLQGPPEPRDARPAHRLGLPLRRHPGPPVRRVDDAAGGSRDARREDRLGDPAGRRSGGRPTASLPRRRTRRSITVASSVAGRPPAGDPGRSPTRSRRPIGAAPDQWYSFKPMWPATQEEAAELEARAAAMLADDGSAPARRGSCQLARAARRRRSVREPRRCRGRRARRRPSPEDRGGVTAAEARRPRGTPGQRLRARGLTTASWLACHLPEAPLVALAEWSGACRTASRPSEPPRPGATSAASSATSTDNGLADARTRAAATDPRALERLVRSAFRQHARYYLEILRAPGLDFARLDDRIVVETPEDVEAAFARDVPIVFIAATSGPIELPGLYLADRSGGRPVVAPMETLDDPALQGWFERTRGRVRRPDRDAPRGASRAGGRAEAWRARRARRRPRRHRRRDRGPVLRLAGADPDRARAPRDRDRRTDLRRGRLADRPAAVSPAGSTRSRSRPRARAASGSRRRSPPRPRPSSG